MKWLARCALIAVLAPALHSAAHPVRTGSFPTLRFGVAAGHTWWMQGANPQRDFRSDGVLPDIQPPLLWSHELENRTLGILVLRDRSMWALSTHHLTLVGADGRQRHQVQIQRPRGGLALQPSGDVVFPARDGLIRASASGDETQTTEVESLPMGEPLVLDDGSTVVATQEGSIRRIRVNGRQIFSAGGARSTTPMVARFEDELIFLSFEALTWMTMSGEVIRSIPLDGGMLGPAVARDGSVWIATGRAQKLLHYSRSGGLISETQLPGVPTATSAIAIAPDQSVRIGTLQGLVAAGDEGVLWHLPATTIHGISVDARGNTIAAMGRSPTHIRAFTPAGQTMWTIRPSPEQRLVGPPVPLDNGFVIASASGRILRYGTP